MIIRRIKPMRNQLIWRHFIHLLNLPDLIGLTKQHGPRLTFHASIQSMSVSFTVVVKWK